MKKETVGYITRTGGFSRLVSDVENTREPVQIVRHNQTVAMIVPANDELAQLLSDIIDNGKLIQSSTTNRIDFVRVLVGYALLGDVSKRLLSQTGYDEVDKAVSNVLENFGRG